MTAPVIRGAEPFAAEGGPDGALVVHGFTGNCGSMVGIARAFAGAGWGVECPLLPGHGTAMEDMLDTTWDDWSSAAEETYQRVAASVPGRLVVVGLSMGGTLTSWLAAKHAADGRLAGIVCINPAVEPPGPMLDLVDAAIANGDEVMPGIGSDVADPDVQESAYPGTPLRALRSLLGAVDALQPRLADITCPVLLFTSTDDHVVPPSNSDHLAASVSGPVERVTLTRSFHVATIDYDKDLIVERTLDFAAKVTA
jgi:carboxylesterase